MLYYITIKGLLWCESYRSNVATWFRFRLFGHFVLLVSIISLKGSCDQGNMLIYASNSPATINIMKFPEVDFSCKPRSNIVLRQLKKIHYLKNCCSINRKVHKCSLQILTFSYVISNFILLTLLFRNGKKHHKFIWPEICWR